MDLKLTAFHLAEDIFQLDKNIEFVGYSLYSQIDKIPKNQKSEFITLLEEELQLYNPKNINMFRFRIKEYSSDPTNTNIERIGDKILFKSIIGGHLLYFKNTTRLFDVIGIIGKSTQHIETILDDIKSIKKTAISFEEIRDKIREYQIQKIEEGTQVIFRSDLFKRWGQEDIHIGAFGLNQKVAKDKPICSFEISDKSWDEKNYNDYYNYATHHLEIIKKSISKEKEIRLAEHCVSVNGYDLISIAGKLSKDTLAGKKYFEFDKGTGVMRWDKVPAKRWQKYITAFLFFFHKKGFVNILELSNLDLIAACKNQFNCGEIHNENIKQLKNWIKIKDTKVLNETIREDEYLSHYRDFFSTAMK